MPYSTEEGHSECDEGEVAVVKDSGGEVMGCHQSESAAQEQIAALEASEDDRTVPLFALRSELGEEVGRLLSRLGLQTRVDAREMMETVASTFWRRFDDMPEEDYLVPEVYVTDASEEMASGWLVAVNRSTERYWRAGWSYDDSGAGPAEVEYDDKDTWTEVEEQWVPVDGEAERLVGQAVTRKMSAERADPDELSVGTQVRWDASGGTAYGEIEEVVTDGQISADPEGPTMEGSEDDPAYGVRVYDTNADGEWEETDTLTVHRAGALTVIDSFPEERSREAGQDHRAILQGAELRMSSDGERTTIQFMTEDVARDGIVLDADGLDLSAYRENPVVLWQHGKDPRRGGQPIAKTVDISRNSDGYLATIEWYDDDFSQEIKRQVKEGYLNAASIGWRSEDLDWDESPPRVSESDMTEFSIVSVPADTGALVEERSGDQDPLNELRNEIDSLRDEIRELKDEKQEEGHGATAPSPPDATDPAATGEGSAAEDRDAAQEERYVRLSDLKALREQREKERRASIRTELKKALGMA